MKVLDVFEKFLVVLLFCCIFALIYVSVDNYLWFHNWEKDMKTTLQELRSIENELDSLSQELAKERS